MGCDLLRSIDSVHPKTSESPSTHPSHPHLLAASPSKAPVSHGRSVPRSRSQRHPAWPRDGPGVPAPSSSGCAKGEEELKWIPVLFASVCPWTGRTGLHVGKRKRKHEKQITQEIMVGGRGTCGVTQLFGWIHEM